MNGQDIAAILCVTCLCAALAIILAPLLPWLALGAGVLVLVVFVIAKVLA